MTIPRSAFTVDDCSEEAIKLIERKDWEKENPLPYRDNQIPWNRLSVGKSIWFDLDSLKPDQVRGLRLAVRRYNEMYNNLFEIIKHRWDLRKSGFKYLEIARIK